MAAGAAGEAKAAEGVAGESSMLPWDDAGLSHIFSEGRYCTHCFLLLIEKSGDKQRRREEAELWICCWLRIWFMSLNAAGDRSERVIIKTVKTMAVKALKHDMFKSTWEHVTRGRVKQDVNRFKWYAFMMQKKRT